MYSTDGSLHAMLTLISVARLTITSGMCTRESNQRYMHELARRTLLLFFLFRGGEGRGGEEGLCTQRALEPYPSPLSVSAVLSSWIVVKIRYMWLANMQAIH